MLDSSSALIKAITAGLESVGIRGTSADAINALAGSPLPDYFRVLSGGRDASKDPSYDPFVAAFRDAYNLESVPAFGDVYAGLAALRRAVPAQVPFAIATTKPTARAEHEVRAAGLGGFFAHVQGTDVGMSPKPAPDVILAAARALGKDPRRCVYFGDTERDVAAAKSGGLAAAVSVLYPLSPLSHALPVKGVGAAQNNSWGADVSVSGVASLAAYAPLLLARIASVAGG